MAIAFYNDHYKTILLFTFGLALNALLLKNINKSP